MSFTSDEVNYLIYRYLEESGNVNLVGEGKGWRRTAREPGLSKGDAAARGRTRGRDVGRE